MKRIINYFKELLSTLKSIDERLKTLESCVRYDRCPSHRNHGNEKVLKVQSGYE